MNAVLLADRLARLARLSPGSPGSHNTAGRCRYVRESFGAVSALILDCGNGRRRLISTMLPSSFGPEISPTARLDAARLNVAKLAELESADPATLATADTELVNAIIGARLAELADWRNTAALTRLAAPDARMRAVNAELGAKLAVAAKLADRDTAARLDASNTAARLDRATRAIDAMSADELLAFAARLDAVKRSAA